MIPSARPTIPSVAIIILKWFLRIFEKWVLTYGHTDVLRVICVIIVITTGRVDQFFLVSKRNKKVRGRNKYFCSFSPAEWTEATTEIYWSTRPTHSHSWHGSLFSHMSSVVLPHVSKSSKTMWKQISLLVWPSGSLMTPCKNYTWQCDAIIGKNLIYSEL